MADPDVAKRLGKKFRQGIDAHDQNTRLRIHRAISWIARAQAEQNDHDARFVFLWIAFNAAYASELALEGCARDQIAAYFKRLIERDAQGRVAALLLRQFTGPIRTMIANKYVFEPFWRALREHDDSDRWKTKFEEDNRLALRAVMEGGTEHVLAVVFDRLYVLRNQLVHGGATWNSSVNRNQVRDGSNLMMSLVPVLVELMIDHPDAGFGDILYPVLPTV